MIRTLALSGLFALLSLSAGAQTTLHFHEGQRVDPDAVKQILDNVDGTEIRTRSIRMLDNPGAAATDQGAIPSALSLPVRFDFDSATIQASAREQLDALAKGIKLLPPQRTVLIEGHTDASGPDDYNQQLSQRRAAAVKNYLVQAHGIDPRRLRDAGLGKRQPITGSDPNSAENRRVQFRGA